MASFDVLRLTEAAPERQVDAGETIIGFGDSEPALFVLVSGELEVRRDGATLARLAEPGAIVGELSLLLGTPASADVVAIEPSVVRRVDDAEQLFRDVPEFGQHLAITLAGRLHRVTTFLGDLQEQFADRPGTLGLVPTVLTGLLSREQRDVELGSDREPDSPY
jgi:CRP/FNR family transcriptional regulator, cyclic AMP receptor protein